MATLKSLVDETTNIKNELVECHTNLKNNLIEKGVECSDTDKMLSLIDKVVNVNTVTEYTVSNNPFVRSDLQLNIGYAGGNVLVMYLKTGFKGSIRVQTELGDDMAVYVSVVRGGDVVYTSNTITNKGAHFFDVNNLEVGDEVSVYGKCRLYQGSGRLSYVRICGDII